MDGSSTVFPITDEVAEEFQKKHRRVRVTVGISGTGGGFKKFFFAYRMFGDEPPRCHSGFATADT